jgi:hypothetical protein
MERYMKEAGRVLTVLYDKEVTATRSRVCREE